LAHPVCTLPILLKLSDKVGSSVSMVTRLRAGLLDNIGSISGKEEPELYSRVFGPTAWPTSIYSVGAVYVSQGVKWPKCRADHSCLVLKLREGGSVLPLSHISSWCTERHNPYGMKFVLQKWWNKIIRIILSSNGVSCNMIMFHVLTMQLILSLYYAIFKFMDTNRSFEVC
jgi:hypothetical protein